MGRKQIASKGQKPSRKHLRVQPTLEKKKTSKSEKHDTTSTFKRVAEFRSNLIGFLKLYRTVEKRISEKCIAAIKRTPFWELFEAYKEGQIKDEDYIKKDHLILDIIRCYDPDTKTFIIGNKQVKLTTNDVSRLFSLPTGKKEMELKSKGNSVKDERFKDKWFKQLNKMKKPAIEKAIEVASTLDTDEGAEDFARLVIIHMSTTIFFSNQDSSIGFYILKYLRKIDRISTYNWAGAIRNRLMESIHTNYHDQSASKVTGCLILLPFWLAEHTTLIRPLASLPMPCFLRWNLKKLHTEVKKITFENLSGEDVHTWSYSLRNLDQANNSADLSREVCKLKTKLCKYEEEIKALKEKISLDTMNFENKITKLEGQVFVLEKENEELKKFSEKAEQNVRDEEKEENKGNAKPNEGSPILDDVGSDDFYKKVDEVMGKLEASCYEEMKKGKSDSHGKENLAESSTKGTRKKALVKVKQTIIPPWELSRQRSSGKEHVRDEIKNPGKKEKSHVMDKTAKEKISMIEGMNLITKTDGQSSLVNRLKTKTRKPKVDNDFVPTKKKSRQTQTVALNKPPSKRFPGGKRLIYNLLSDKDKSYMDAIHTLYGDSYIWGDISQSIVLLEDLINLIGNESISNLVVDAFTNILTRQLESRSDKKEHFFFGSNVFNAARDCQHTELDRLLKTTIKFSRHYKYNYFPILSTKSRESNVGHHWTLLRFETQDGLWTHYNPLRGRPAHLDQSFNDAILMKNTIEDYFRKNNNIASGETQTIIESSLDCPQQLPRTLDCGPMICFYMHELANGRDLVSNVSRNTIKNFRAEIATNILNDPGFTRELI